MPVMGLQSNRSERDLKRRSTLDPYNFFKQRDAHERTGTSYSASGSSATRAASEDGQRGRRPLSIYTDEGRPPTPPIQPATPNTHRFSMLRWRHASDSQLSIKAKEHAEQDIPPVPAMPTNMTSKQRLPSSDNAENHAATPSLMVTAPTVEAPQKPTLIRRKSRKFHPFTRQKQSNGPIVVEPPLERRSMDTRRRTEYRKSRFATFGRSKDPIEELRMLAGSRVGTPNSEDAPSLGQQKAGSSLTLPIGRKSESSRSDGDLGGAFKGGNTTPERPILSQTNSTFPWLSRRNKQRTSLFPLPVRIPPPDSSTTSTQPQTPRASTSARSNGSPEPSPARSSLQKENQASFHANGIHSAPGQYPSAALAAASISFAAPGGALLRNNSIHSQQSSRSSPALAPPMATRRTRSSTLGSTSGRSEDQPPPTPPFANGSGRNSTSTTGRSSFSNLFNLSHRLRHGSDPHSPRQGSPAHGLGTPVLGSHTNSITLSREHIALPDRQEGETSMQFLARAEDVVPRSQIPSVLSKSTDDFLYAVMRSFMRKFGFFGDPLDMALRKLLMEVDLPKETQQIDRVLQSFADRYHECNPGIFPDSEKAYYLTFSLLLLQSDFFNRNNKKKMGKQDYVKNTSTDGVSDDVLDCYYDNIIYTPFIRVEDDMDAKTIASRKSRKTPKALKHAIPEPVKKPSREPLDPYTLIFENRLDTLRPPLKGVIAVDDPYSYLGTAPSLEKRLLKSSKCGIIQLESARSRPDAFIAENSEEAKVGIVDLPVDKVGVLWRKDPKKKTARSPWQEWGAILTGTGLYFFKNAGFVKNFIHQYEQHVRHGQSGGPCVFKPIITSWKADYMFPIDNSVALHDGSYRKHKNAFVFFRHNNADEVFLADNEAEMNDWLAKLNHQAAFKTAGIRQRGLVGGHYDGQRQRGMRRLDSSTSTATLQTIQTPTGEVTIQSGKIDQDLAQQISDARRDNMQQKLIEAEDRLAELMKLERDQKRDASHLLIMAPIQERTRNNLMHAASRVSAQLKWTRIDIWRIKCHRDILAMDLEEERLEAQRRQDRINKLAGKATSIASQSTASTARPRLNGIERLNSTATATASILQSPPRGQHSPASSRRPDTQSSETSSNDFAEDDDVFRTPPERTPAGTPVPSSTAAPANTPTGTPISIKIQPSGHRGSFVSSITRSPRLRPQSSNFDQPPESPSLSEYRTPMLTDAEAEAQREDDPVETSPSNLDGASTDRPDTAKSAEPDHERDADAPLPSMAGSPDSRSKVRRSLQRSLRDPTGRDSQNSVHHRHSSRRHPKGDSVSSAVLPEEAVIDSSTPLEPSEGLKRQHGSFTVHGKKASVVTFGGDWANMSAEERLKGLTRNESQTSTSMKDRDGVVLRDMTISPPSIGGSTRGSIKGNEKEKQNSISSASSSQPNHGFSIPPRKSSLSLRERRVQSNRKFSSASSGSAPPMMLLESPSLAEGGKVKDRDKRPVNGNGITGDESAIVDGEDDTPEPRKEERAPPVAANQAKAVEV